MVRMRTTARKSIPIKPLELGSVDKFYSYKMSRTTCMHFFLRCYRRMWESVRGLGVSELDGVLQLVYALLPEWQPWAATVALNFVHPDMEARVTGNLAGFIELLDEQYQFDKHPPSGTYPPIDKFIPTVHQTLSNILAPREPTPELEPNEIDEDFLATAEFENFLEDLDSSEYIGKELTSIDLDLYDQPFALRTPSPVTPSAEPQIENLIVVGTSTLRSIPMSETNFNDKPYDTNVGVPDQPSTSHPQPYREESDPETPEGYYDLSIKFED